MLAFVGVASGAELSQWAASYDPVAKTRYIPVELWTGAEWDGSRELKMAPADFSFGKRSEKRISGPLAWKRPGTGETIQVYERDNRGLACELRIVALKLRPDLLRCRALTRLGALRGQTLRHRRCC